MTLPSELLPVGLLGAGADDYEIERSLRFNSADSAYLSKTFSTFTSRTVGTISFWFKLGKLSVFRTFAAGWDGGVSYSGSISLANTDNLFVGIGGAAEYGFRTNAVFRDPSAWYHVVVAWNQGASSVDRVKVWVNGVSQTSSDTGYQSWSSGNCQIFCPNTANRIGRGDGDRYGNFLDGYLAEYFFIDGQALEPTSFGEFDDNGIWQPKLYDGTYGTNGFKLNFSDNSAATATTLGKDSSGNSNNWTPFNLSVTAGSGNDSLIDVPTNGTQTDTGLGGQVRGNYCTWNPLQGRGQTLTDGNLRASVLNASGGWVSGTFGVSSGKWYWECIPQDITTKTIGMLSVPYSLSDRPYFNAFGYVYSSTGNKVNNSSVGTSYGSTYSIGDVIGIAYDADAGSLTFYKNGVSQGVAFTGMSGFFVPLFTDQEGGSTAACIANFGQRPFAYQAPSGFKSLNTANLPTPTILDGSEYMDVALYTGNDGTQSISGLDFSPDLVWMKARNYSLDNVLYDTVRGTGTTKSLSSNITYEEGFYSNNTNLTSFDSNGFTLGTTAGINGINYLNATYVAWTWDAGSSTVTNTNGTITSSVRANPSAGFSIVTWTFPASGAFTVGHGLGAAPYLVITKTRSVSNNWNTYHFSTGATGQFRLNVTNAVSTGSVVWNSTAPTSSVFSIGSSYTTAASNATAVAYCFAPVEGYSSFGSYTGNGSTDGPFIFCNFRPRWIMVKSSSIGGSSGYDWIIHDTERSSFNLSATQLIANSYVAENTDSGGASTSGFGWDILSNGFKLRTNTGGRNASGQTYIYAAFAENPFSVARAR